MNLVAFLISCFGNMILIYFLIPLLVKMKFGQNIYELAPESHQKKQGVPTIGGISFVIMTTLLGFILLGFKNKHILVIFSMILFGMIGFIDDALKVFKEENKGLGAKQKLVLQIFASLLIAYLLRDHAQRILIPFTGTIFI